VAGQVVVELTAQDKVSGVLDRISGASKRLNQSIRAATGKAGQSFNNLKNKAVSLQGVLASLGAGAAIKGFAQAGIEADRTAKRLKFLGDQFGETSKLQELANKSAEKFAIGQTDAEKAVSNLYGRLRPMEIGLDDVATVFEGVNVAAKQMSLSTADTEGVMLQLSQALGSGKLQGDDFGSVMARLPKIGQAVAKSMGVQVSELKSLSSAGALTTQEIIKAMRGVREEGFPPPDSVMAFNKAISDLSTAIGQRLTPVLGPVLDVITGLVNKFLSLPEPVQAAAIAFAGIGTAFAVIAPLLPVIVAGVAAIVTTLTGPVGIIAAIGGAAAAFLTMRGKAEEAKKPVVQVRDETDKLKAATEAAARAKQDFINRSQSAVKSLEAEKQQIKAQEQAFDNALRITDARLQAEADINDLQIKGLEIAYENAGSAEKRLNIARRIFQQEIDGAQIAYQQTLNSIKAEETRLQFRRQAAELEARMIRAKGELAAAEADSAQKAALIMEKTKQAVQVQRQNVKLIDGQIRAQSKIAEQMVRSADAQFKMAVQTAEQNLKQKLVSDEIGMSEKKANALAGRMGDSVRNSNQLVNLTGQVSTNAANAEGNFIRVATAADQAANSIARAATAQRSLNAARARPNPQAQQTTAQPVQQAAGGYNLGSFAPFAKGGVVRGPTLGLIGEGGEPEYIIPQSKAAGFAANFLSGKRGAGAIPGFADGGMALPSSANVSIQTGPVTQMDGQNFVTTADLGAAVEAGVMQTLDMLRRDQMTRYSMGLS
tara:strand:+ start:566 stop:2875 length:2310 start_codon:yes stop_codon:yes gene_type:complete